MFVCITHLPGRAEDWRILRLTEADAQSEAADFRALCAEHFADRPGAWARVEPATLDDAAEYAARTDEHYGETFAEAGSGAMSLGYGRDGAYDAANAAAAGILSDPLYLASRAMLDAARPVAPAPAAPAADDIPF